MTNIPHKAGEAGAVAPIRSTEPAVWPRPRISVARLWLSGALLLVTGVAAGLTAFGDFLSGPPAMVGSARGTALVLLVVTSPVLAAAMTMAVRGSCRGVVIWLGALAAVLYNAQLLLYATPFNSLFLLYVAMLGLSVWSIGTLVLSELTTPETSRADDSMPVRSIAAYVWIVAGVNAVVWLRTIVTAVFSAEPASVLVGTGLTTNPVYVQDLALWLPLAITAGIWLVRGSAAGILVVGGILTMWVIESISIAVDQWWGHQADPESLVVSSALVPAFILIGAIGMVPLLILLRHMTPVAGGQGQGLGSGRRVLPTDATGAES